MDGTGRRRSACGFASCAALALAISASAWAAEEEYRYPAPERLVAFGDVHGAYDALTRTLKAAGVVDAELHWSGGHATLVSVGDLMDRGADSRKVLDLLMRLETEAQAAGGRTLVLLGNHEVMNLVGELRDATPAEFAAYAAEETADERKSALAHWLESRPPEQADAARAEFERRFPAGWFAHRRLFLPEGRYGQWLLARPIAIVVGDTAFAHGGFSRTVEDYDLARLNSEFRRGLRDELAAIATLEGAGWIDFDVPGETRAQTLSERMAKADANVDAALVAAAKSAIGFDQAPLYSPQGPAWYRGAALCRSINEIDVADAALRRLGVARIAVGHTTTPTLRPTARLGGRVLLLDTGMLKATYGGRGHALVIEGAKIGAIDEDGTRVELVSDERPSDVVPARGGDAAVEAALTGATLASRGDDAGGHAPAQLDYKGSKLSAWFFPDAKQQAEHELAAYRLDRALGLGLVLGTVPRELGKERGALQWRPERVIAMSADGKAPPNIAPWCEPGPQVGLLAVWDSLIANPARATTSLSWDRDTGTVLASEHGRAFGTSESVPALSGGRKYAIGPELCRRLAALNAEGLKTALGDTLGDKPRAALLARRDKLVRQAGCSPPS